MNMLKLDGKHSVVTGGASGIGRAIALEFARAGSSVTILDLDAASAESAAQALAGETGAKVSAIAVNVADEKSVEDAFAQLNNTGATSIDVLVNSAGVAHIGTVLDTNAADFDRLYNINVRGTFLCMKSAAQLMQQQRSGVILNLASIAATAGLKDRFAYSMTKGAVLAMTLSAAKDLLPFGIRCNCLSPARVHTPFVDGFVARTYPGREQEMMQTLAAAQPIGRMGRPEEIAWMALYLCSDAGSFLTGADIPLDGGFQTLR